MKSNNILQFVLVVAVTCTTCLAGQHFNCPVFFEAWGNKCYYFQGAHQSLALAEFTCGNLAATPVLVESQAEANYLANKLTTIDPTGASHEGFWSRCSDKTVEGQWTCQSSSNYWNSVNDHQGYWDWDTNEPAGGTSENCLILGYDGALKSAPCQLTLSFNGAACEIVMVTVTETPVTQVPFTQTPFTQTPFTQTVTEKPGPSFDCPVFFEAWGYKCYHFQGAHQSLALAEYTCGNLAATPVLVESQDEANYLANKLTTIDPTGASHEGFWSRCSDKTVEGQWTCQSSSNYWNSVNDYKGFWNWDTNEPAGGTSENCLILGYDGTLKSALCQLTLSFNGAACEIVMVTVTEAPVTEKPAGPTLRWCTISDLEQEKCIAMAQKLNSVFYSDVTCVQRSSRLLCMSAIADDEADVVTLDGGDIYIAGKDYDMKPVMAEDYGDNEFSYWAVAVTKATSSITFDNLRGKKSCHTGIEKTSGWIIPIGLLIEKGYIQTRNYICNIPQAVGEFFSQSCVPGAKNSTYDPIGENPDNLCELCIGEGDAKCARSQEEPYYDYSGSFRCLAEGAGEVAFMKHTTVPSNTDGNTPLSWGFNASSSDYKLLCLDGTTVSDVNNYLDCNLASVPSHALMTSGDKNNGFVNEVRDLLLEAQKLYGDDNNSNGFKMFDSSDFGGSDLLFKDSTAQLLDVGSKDTYQEFLGNEYLEAVKAINCDGCALLQASVVVIVTLLFAAFGFQ